VEREQPSKCLEGNNELFYANFKPLLNSKQWLNNLIEQALALFLNCVSNSLSLPSKSEVIAQYIFKSIFMTRSFVFNFLYQKDKSGINTRLWMKMILNNYSFSFPLTFQTFTFFSLW
jgi:hypothetical protein